MDLIIRTVRPEDHEALLSIAMRAWEPVFASVNEALGVELARILHGEDWRDHQTAELREIFASDVDSTWVAVIDGRPVGFAAARIADLGRRIGEVRIVGVDPTVQQLGIGSALMGQAEHWLQEQGMIVVFVGTGGDAGHLPARGLYAALGYHHFPSAQFFRILPRSD